MSADVRDLSKRGILRRILAVVERSETLVTAASDYMHAALDSLDLQLSNLQTRLAADAANLRAALEQVTLAEEDRATLLEAAGRVQATAQLVSNLAQPSAVADPAQPDVTAEPIPTEPTDGQAPTA
jgi:hypothetical protein